MALLQRPPLRLPLSPALGDPHQQLRPPLSLPLSPALEDQHRGGLHAIAPLTARRTARRQQGAQANPWLGSERIYYLNKKNARTLNKGGP